MILRMSMSSCFLTWPYRGNPSHRQRLTEAIVSRLSSLKAPRQLSGLSTSIWSEVLLPGELFSATVILYTWPLAAFTRLSCPGLAPRVSPSRQPPRVRLSKPSWNLCLGTGGGVTEAELPSSWISFLLALIDLSLALVNTEARKQVLEMSQISV